MAGDPDDADTIVITEVWESAEAHRAPLSLPSVRAAIARGRPMVAVPAPPTVTVPLGGHGLAR